MDKMTKNLFDTQRACLAASSYNPPDPLTLFGLGRGGGGGGKMLLLKGFAKYLKNRLTDFHQTF